MNFDFNDEQRAIKEAARDMLAKRYRVEEVRRLAVEDERGFTDEQWRELAEDPWTYRFLRARANSIEGGTTEILKNIVAERVLGLPRLR